jgi:hypothetical protein
MISKPLPWLHWLITNNRVSNACVPTTKTDSGRIGRYFDSLAESHHRRGSSEHAEYLSALNAGQVVIEVHAMDDHNGHVYYVPIGVTTSNLKRALLRCKQPIAVMTLALIPIVANTAGHQNALIVNKATRTYERFEPHGSVSSVTRQIDAFMDSAEFRKYLPEADYTYIPPSEVCPAIGPQTADTPLHCKIGGFCVVYSTMYLHLRLLLPYSTPEQVYDMWLRLTPRKLTETIIRYYGWMEEVVGSRDSDRLKTVVVRDLVSPSVRVS